MRLQKVYLVFKKDWREVKRNWQVIMPIVVIPFLFSVLLPIIILEVPSLSSIPESPSPNLDIAPIVKNLPQHIKIELAGMTDHQILVYIMSLYFFAPFFLVIPLMASSVIASDSFAGEKERKTIEALLATPLSDGELFLGKMLVSFIPSMIVTVIAFFIYSSIVNIISTIIFHGRFLLPNLVWIFLIFGLAPTVALAGIGLTVMISVKVKGVREAQQISAVLLVPILMLVFGQLSGAVIFGAKIVGILVGIFVLIDIVIFKMGVRVFKREEILSKIS